MNSISWLIYLAQVSNGVGILFAFCGGFAAVACIIGLICHIAGHCESSTEAHTCGRKILKWAMPLAFVFFLLANLFPTKDTLYAIAASEIGEKVVNNGEVKALAGDAYAAIRAWMKKQTEQPAK